MSDLNEVTLSGNIGKAPEFRRTTGTSVCNLSVASNKTVQGEERPEWHRIVAFGALAEVISRNAAVGRKVIVKGYLKTREFEGVVEVTLENGQKVSGKARRWITEIIATTIYWMDSKPGGSSNNGYHQDDPGPGAGDDDIPF